MKETVVSCTHDDSACLMAWMAWLSWDVRMKWKRESAYRAEPEAGNCSIL